MNQDFSSKEDLVYDISFLVYSVLLIGACLTGLAIVNFWDCSGSKTVSVLDSKGKPVQVYEAKGPSILPHFFSRGVTFETTRGDLVKLGHSNFSISECND